MNEDGEHIKIIKQRYAKGEISKKKYLEMKAALKEDAVEKNENTHSNSRKPEHPDKRRNKGIKTWQIFLGGALIVVFLAIILALSSSPTYNVSQQNAGSINDPYSVSLGYQGPGYYSYSGVPVYMGNITQFDTFLSTSSYTSTSSSIQFTIPSTTTSTIYSTTSGSTTVIYYTIPQYTTTSTIYQSSYYGCSPLPCNYTSNGNFIFVFTLQNGSVDSWTFPITTYNEYVSAPRIDPIIRLNNSGKTLYTWDYRSTVTPYFFDKVTPTLTTGRNAQQFVNEVKNIKNQLTGYSLLFYNTSVYPAQVLAQRQGDCKDLGVLMASILVAGNQQAGYGMNISLEYVDAENLSNPQAVNHLILYIKFANGTYEYLDTTDVLQTYSGNVFGWRFPLICNATTCQSTTICNGAYCDAVGYVNGSRTGFNYCSNKADVVGYDNLCHPQCGADWYCSSGYHCNYNNVCASG